MNTFPTTSTTEDMPEKDHVTTSQTLFPRSVTQDSYGQRTQRLYIQNLQSDIVNNSFGEEQVGLSEEMENEKDNDAEELEEVFFSRYHQEIWQKDHRNDAYEIEKTSLFNIWKGSNDCLNEDGDKFDTVISDHVYAVCFRPNQSRNKHLFLNDNSTCDQQDTLTHKSSDKAVQVSIEKKCYVEMGTQTENEAKSFTEIGVQVGTVPIAEKEITTSGHMFLNQNNKEHNIENNSTCTNTHRIHKKTYQVHTFMNDIVVRKFYPTNKTDVVQGLHIDKPTGQRSGSRRVHPVCQRNVAVEEQDKLVAKKTCTVRLANQNQKVIVGEDVNTPTTDKYNTQLLKDETDIKTNLKEAIGDVMKLQNSKDVQKASIHVPCEGIKTNMKIPIDDVMKLQNSKDFQKAPIHVACEGIKTNMKIPIDDVMKLQKSKDVQEASIHVPCEGIKTNMKIPIDDVMKLQNSKDVQKVSIDIPCQDLDEGSASARTENTIGSHKSNNGIHVDEIKYTEINNEPPEINTESDVIKSFEDNLNHDHNYVQIENPSQKYLLANTKRHICTICGKRFSLPSQLRKHYPTHNRVENEKRPYVCEICGKGFYYTSHLKTHIRYHTGDQHFICQICGKKFNENYGLKMHLLIHSQEKPLKCEACGHRFKHQSNLRKHVKIHTGDKSYMCEICGKGFISAARLRTHSTAHSDEKLFVCEFCGERFKQNTSLRRHILAHTTTSQKYFICKICNRRFDDKNDLATHSNVHTGIKPYMCEKCGSKFVHFGNLQQHIQNYHV